MSEQHLDQDELARRTHRANLALSELEERIFSTCVAAASEVDATLRVAGGWVRDRLRGTPSDDIDITVDNMTGEAFARHLVAHIAARPDDTSGVGLAPSGEPLVHLDAVVRGNPEKSKHLETAIVHLYGVPIDFCNLRTESYDREAAGRVPSSVRFASAYEDAMRRDLTINALFYNIHTKRVEDLSGRGLDDLRAGIVRTPLDPLETFLDDPLRVLRAVRFAARYDFRIDDELAVATRNAEVRERLRSNVSRERVWKELSSMLRHRSRAVDALCSLERLGLDDIVWPATTTSSSSSSSTTSSSSVSSSMMRDGDVHLSSECARRVHVVAEHSGVASTSSLDAAVASGGAEGEEVNAWSRTRITLFVAAYVWPLAARERDGDSATTTFVSCEDMLVSMKVPKVIFSPVAKAHEFTSTLARLVEVASSSPSSTRTLVSRVASLDRLDLALAVRQVGAEWRVAACVATSCLVESAEAACEVYDALHARVVELDLTRCYDVRPAINGRDVIALVAEARGLSCELAPGPFVRPLVDAILHRQLKEPDVTLDALREYVRERARLLDASALRPRHAGAGKSSKKKRK